MCKSLTFSLTSLLRSQSNEEKFVYLFTFHLLTTLVTKSRGTFSHIITDKEDKFNMKTRLQNSRSLFFS